MGWQVITGLAGGVGLFLLGMELMTEGLKLSAGKSLQRILKSSTKTPLRGVLSGALITSLVQASGAVTVATIGFVNAGLMKLKGAIRVVYGSNLGTTMTGWLVAIVGFNINLKAFALPAIGIGMLMALLIKHGRYPAVGKVIAGFGLFFLGIDMMKTGFEGLQGSFSLDAIEEGGWISLVVFSGVGFVMTVLMQSSSAAIAMTLTAAAGGIIALPSAACMVIGANIGTTSTAVLAAIGATPNARRMAAAHVVFNVVTGVAAIILLPLLLFAIETFQHISGMEGGPATFLALFHTVFNVLGIALLWPFTDRLVRYLKTWFVAAEENEALPKYLDDTVIGTPELAHKALVMEIERIQSISIRMAEDAISTEASVSPRLKVDLDILYRLNDAVGDFSAKLRKSNLPESVANALPMALASTRYFIDVAEMAEEIDKLQSKEVIGIDEALELSLSDMRRQAVAILEDVKLQKPGSDEVLERESGAIDSLTKNYNAIKSQLLRAGTTGKLSARHMVALIELMKSIERLVTNCVKGQSSLQVFSHQLTAEKPNTDEKELSLQEEAPEVAKEKEDGDLAGSESEYEETNKSNS
ncbi:phosphate:Na+ symporter [Mariprofundus ferrinatatus]|uniref:Phosphate:Na+ symporter n=1 Tax=Mariprofundus ferrinatatus TaxID=1921087 RepID=A0A2K8L3A3_9PROT|nr:Na/Pi symporter [Mariprofundus ferrinatatus]ATX81757.1 phosphate:Na+ symporter [Mariprofundus ferrinatatus]